MSMKNRNEDGFTGLEAAIVLIAFVVVAAVFSYVVLGAGFFTTQKSQQVVHAGVTQAASNIVVKGEVYGLNSSAIPIDAVSVIRFDIGLAAGGLPVDVDRMTIVMSTNASVTTLSQTQTANMDPTSNTWNVQSTNNAGSGTDHLLQADEVFTIYLKPNTTQPLYPRTVFNIELKPETGASLGIMRTIQPGLSNVNLLY
ncbi:MAG: flagellin [Methanomicrobiales archaeon]|nr:flagellin [Methanomicrobiales archaeon]